MTIAQTLSKYSKQLKSSSPILDVELLLSKTLNKPKEFLYTYPKKKLTTKQIEKFTTIFKRRLKGEPIAYIFGHKEFFGLDFKVNKNILIPRPETEELVEAVINFAKDKQPLTILEIGVGSGAIIISLAKNLNGAKFIGSDISSKAIAVAEQNAKLNKVKIKFIHGNLLKPITKLQTSAFDFQTSIIVANLPYLTTKQLNNQQLKYEPITALSGGPDGLKYFREFFNQLYKFKIQPTAIFLEIGHNQAQKISNLAKRVLPDHKIKIKKDLCGFDRIISLTK